MRQVVDAILYLTMGDNLRRVLPLTALTGAFFVLADDTGIPAAVQVLQALPDRQITALFEVMDEQERRPLPAIDDDMPGWLYREPYGLTAGVPLEQAVKQARIPAGRGNAGSHSDVDLRAVFL